MLLVSLQVAWKSAGDPKAQRPWWFAGIFVVGFFLSTYSQPSGWVCALLLTAATFLALLVSSWKARRMEPVLLVCALLVLFVGIPLLSFDWALPQMRQIMTAEHLAYNKRVFTGGGTLPEFLRSLLASFGYGGTPARLALTATSLIGALVTGLWNWRKNSRLPGLFLILAAGLVGFMVSQSSTNAPYEVRYMLAFFPIWTLLMAAGLDSLVRAAGRRSRHLAQAGTPLAFAVILAFYGQAAWTSTQLTGKPTPYKEISSWMDANLPAGTPVLTDRWFEPWNEFRVYPPQSVVVTFTVPDEPQDTFRQVNWREGARGFFERFPEAAFLEIARNYWNIPDIGPWLWPRTNFVHKHTFTNAAGLRLRELGLANRGDFFTSATNRLLVDLYYNTREDVLAKWRAEGRPAGLWFGAGWRYEKTGPMQWMPVKTREFMEWRAPSAPDAELDVHRFAAGLEKVSLRARGVAVGGLRSLVCTTTGQRQDFPPGQLAEWTIGPVALTGDVTRIRFNDPAYRTGAPPLLLESISIAPQ